VTILETVDFVISFKSRSSGLWHHAVLWRWKQPGPLKHQYPTIALHGITTQKIST